MTITIIFQLSYGYVQLDFSQYMISLFYFTALPWMMMTVLAFLFQIISPNKYTGMFIFVLFILSRFVMEPFGLEHNLFHFSKSPTMLYSDMDGYGTSILAHSWYMLYWGSLSLAIGVVGYGLWQRGSIQDFRSRIRGIAYQIGNRGKQVLIGSGIIFVFSGIAIYYNSVSLNEYYSKNQLIKIHADYEKHYSQYAGRPIPTMTKVNALVDIYPNQRKVKINAEILVENKTLKPIKRFLISMPGYNRFFSTELDYNPLAFSVEINGGSMGSLDGGLNTHWFEFEEPLLPGQSRKGRFFTTIEQEGFSEKNKKILILKNGTFFQNNEVFPIFGYSVSEELRSPEQRKKYNLPPPKRQHKLDESKFYNKSILETILGSNSGYIEFETTVSTSIDQIAVAPGYLIKEWTKDNRRYFHYKMDMPIQNYFAYFSGRYKTKTVIENDIEFSVYFHPQHDMNVDRILQSMKDSVAYYSEIFGPYQHKQARVIEFSSPQNFGQDFPNTIAYSEAAGFIHDLTDPTDNDQVYWFIAHEMAHQWWGAQVEAANVQGGTMLVETLAQYSAFSLVKKKYGDGALRRMLKFEMTRYFKGRSREIIEELALIKVEDQSYIHYNKGAIVMMNLADLLGEKRFNIALQALLKKYKFSQSELATSLDLIEHLLKDANTQEKEVINRALAEINIYELEMLDATVNKINNKQFEVTLTINANRYVSDGKGIEMKKTLSEFIDIGLFIQNPDTLIQRTDAIYLQKHPIVSGINIVKVVVKTEPNFAAIDPYIHIIDRNLDNNMLSPLKNSSN